jgi:hypothetical protein
VHLWLAGYLISAFPAAEWLWNAPVSPHLPGPPGPFRFLTHAFGTWLPSGTALPAAVVLLALALRGVFRPSRWWSALLTWMLFTSLMDQAWLAATGGHHLMANVLFWMIFLPSAPVRWTGIEGKDPMFRSIPALASFWIIRSQLLVAYGATALQKLTGECWTDGTAVGIVSTDPDYGPVFLAGHPLIAKALTFAILGFQLLFPIAVWHRRTRKVWSWMGVIFHLATGITFGIPDMALAFLSVYPIWWSDPPAAGRWNAVLAFGRGPDRPGSP